MKQTPGIFRNYYEATTAILTWLVILSGLLLCGWAVVA